MASSQQAEDGTQRVGDGPEATQTICVNSKVNNKRMKAMSAMKAMSRHDCGAKFDKKQYMKDDMARRRAAVKAINDDIAAAARL